MELTKPAENAIKNLVDLLSAAADEIRRCEETAKKLLYGENNQQAYRVKMRKKSLVLCDLAETVALCDDLPLPVKTLIREKIGSFSFEAERALRLNSVFYMAVLLHTEDHQEDSPNELENLIKSLRYCQ
ncbi:MAG: hypothetical protein PHI06_12030 [Desulfobulbaceae bacterium]|nr:hypothetical protein [Desulfobulbaceae bacterium]